MLKGECADFPLLAEKIKIPAFCSMNGFSKILMWCEGKIKGV